MTRESRRSNRNQKNVPAKNLIAVVIALAICIGIIWKIAGQQITLSDYEALAREKEQNIAKAQLENQKLQDQFNQVKENPDEYIQRQAREKIGLAKPNERIYVDINQ